MELFPDSGGSIRLLRISDFQGGTEQSMYRWVQFARDLGFIEVLALVSTSPESSVHQKPSSPGLLGRSLVRN